LPAGKTRPQVLPDGRGVAAVEVDDGQSGRGLVVLGHQPAAVARRSGEKQFEQGACAGVEARQHDR
jgi:hypothetical protein